MSDDEYCNFRSGGGELSGTISYELPSNYIMNLHITCKCIVCGNEIETTDHSVDYICPDCKEAILWAKQKIKEEMKGGD